MDKKDQILKSRDDKTPLTLIEEVDSEERTTFKLAEGNSCSWTSPGVAVGISTLRERIEPWLTALFQSEHFALLVGSGLTHAVHRLATGSTLPGMATANFGDFDTQITIAAKESAKRAARNEGNIEDQIRVSNELFGAWKYWPARMKRSGNNL